MKNNNRYPEKKKISVLLPSAVADAIKEEAKKMNVTASYLYTQIMCDGFSYMKTQTAIESLSRDLETNYLGLQILGAKLDELVKFLTIRLPSPDVKDDEQKQALRLKAATMARNVATAAEKAVEDFQTGESNVDPLGVEDVLKVIEASINTEIEGK